MSEPQSLSFLITPEAKLSSAGQLRETDSKHMDRKREHVPLLHLVTGWVVIFNMANPGFESVITANAAVRYFLQHHLGEKISNANMAIDQRWKLASAHPPKAPFTKIEIKSPLYSR